MTDTEHRDNYWFCLRCSDRVENKDVTFQETHDGCGGCCEPRSQTEHRDTPVCPHCGGTRIRWDAARVTSRRAAGCMSCLKLFTVQSHRTTTYTSRKVSE